VIPMSQITPPAALAELVLLADSRPDEEDTLARIHWNKEHLERYHSLQAYLVLHPVEDQAEDTPTDPATPPAPPVVPPEPEPVEAPMPQPHHTPAELLELKTATYKRVHAELTADPGCKRLRDQLNTTRYEIRGLAKRLGCAAPDLPPAPESPSKAKPEAASEIVVPPVVAPPAAPQEARIPAVISPLALTPVESIARVRRDIWRLMASLEEMPKDKRAELVDEIALLDAAAHAAYGLVTGKLQVA